MAAEGRHPDFDVAVVGLGVLGAFALRALARRGHRVVGFDAEDPPHALGASHGRTRIIRTAYFEHPLYVPLAREAWGGWRALEEERGVRLLEETGALMLGSRGGRVIRGTLESARTHGLPHEVLDGGALRARFPALASGLVPGPDPDRGAGSGSHSGLAAGGDAGLTGVFEPRAGILQAEGAVEAALASAVAHGARVIKGTRVDPQALADGPGRRVVVAPGGWIGPWVAPWLQLEVERQVVFWFRREDGGEDRGTGGVPPVGLHEYAPGQALYWITEPGLLKAAFHHQGDRVTEPARVERRIRPGEEAALRGRLEALFPGVAGPVVRVSVCQYTNTPDEHFLVGPDPAHPERILLGGGSGHAFKFAPALGERVADWVEGRKVEEAEDPFLPARFLPNPGPPSPRTRN